MKYKVKGLESIVVESVYFVDAENADEAYKKVQAGEVMRTSYQVTDDCEWLQTLSVRKEE